jgi:hypothetical protein
MADTRVSCVDSRQRDYGTGGRAITYVHRCGGLVSSCA